jgi:hypothetical protein
VKCSPLETVVKVGPASTANDCWVDKVEIRRVKETIAIVFLNRFGTAKTDFIGKPYWIYPFI